MKKLVLLVLCVASLGAAAQSKLSPYSRSFIDAGKQANTDLEKTQLTKRFALKNVGTESYVNAFIYLNANESIDELTALGVELNSDFGTFYTARIPASRVEEVAALSCVNYIELGQPVRPKMNNVRTYTNATVAYNGTGTGMSHPYRGDGVIVGVVDYGFQFTHRNFYNAAGDTLRIKRVWNQNKSGTAPANFSGGAEYTTQAAIVAAGYDDQTSDDTGHGTHVTGIAAGGYTANSYYGIAPRADIAMVSYDVDDYSTDNISILNGVKYIFEYAASVNKPAVVNMSLGMHVGPHDGTSTFDRACDAIQGQGLLLVGAAGNEGDLKLHLTKTFSGLAPDTLKSCINFYSGYGSRYSNVDIWGDANQAYTVRAAIVNKTSRAILSQSNPINALSTSTITFSPSSGASGTVSMYAEQNINNNKGNVYVDVTLSNLNSSNALVFIIASEDAGTINAWADGYYSEITNNSMSGYTDGDVNSTVGEIGGSGKRIITVGAYTSNTRNGGSLNSIADFSSLGPTADQRLKPDVTAPGNATISSIPNTQLVRTYSDVVSSATTNNNYWAYMSGTSMASPAVTGVLALWLQTRPTLTPEQARLVIQETSTVDSYTGSVPNNTWGYGKINAAAGISYLIQNDVSTDIEKAPSALAIFPNPSKGEFNILFNRNDDNVRINVYAVNGQLVYSQNIATVAMRQEMAVNLGTVADGAYIVRVNGDKSVSETFRLLINK